MAGLLDGKVAIITGAGGGVGRAYAMLLAREGARIVINDHSVTPEGDAPQPGAKMADLVVAEIAAAGGTAVANYGDVSDPAGARSIIDGALEAFGRIDIVVNNAGIFRERPFAEMSWEDWTSVIDVHLHGSFLVSQLAFRQMVRQGGGGVIVNTTSRTALRGKEYQANYAAAKGALISLTDTIALEGREHGIRALTILPRGLTRGWENAILPSAGAVTDEMRRHFTLDAPALALLYLVSDLAAEHSGKTFFASADTISEVRWEQAPGFKPVAGSTAEDLAQSSARGELAFPGDFDPNRIS
jgi:NAD(P)-dependent dehydrogenase (short-subunit alcohol dehydrogenase family)